MEFLVVLAPFLMQLFNNCNDDNEQRAVVVKRNGPLVRMRLTRALRQEGFKKKKLRKRVREVQEEISMASVGEIREALDEMDGIASGL